MLQRKITELGNYKEVRIKVVWEVIKCFLEARSSWAKGIGWRCSCSCRDRTGEKLVGTVAALLLDQVYVLWKTQVTKYINRERWEPWEINMQGFRKLLRKGGVLTTLWNMSRVLTGGGWRQVAFQNKEETVKTKTLNRKGRDEQFLCTHTHTHTSLSNLFGAWLTLKIIFQDYIVFHHLSAP